MKMLRITAQGGGHYRAGTHHPPSPVEHQPDAFTAAQVEALKADPRLVVVEIDDTPAPAPEPPRKGK